MVGSPTDRAASQSDVGDTDVIARPDQAGRLYILYCGNVRFHAAGVVVGYPASAHIAAQRRLSDLKASLQTVVQEEEGVGTRSCMMPLEGFDPFTS